MRFLPFISRFKRLLWPLTPLSFLFYIAVCFTLYAVAIFLTTSPGVGLFVAISTAITLALFVLYVGDRFLISQFSYGKIVLAELIFILLVSLGYAYAGRSVEIHVKTAQDFSVVLFDSAPQALTQHSALRRTGLFTYTYETAEALIHIDSLAFDREQLRFHYPDDWVPQTYTGSLPYKGRSLDYIVTYKAYQEGISQRAIDSLVFRLLE